jgi:hypothetical protein
MNFYVTFTCYYGGPTDISRGWPEDFPDGINNLPITGVPANHVLIHYTTRYLYGVCLYSVPTDFAAQCATAAATYAIDGDKEKFKQTVLQMVSIKLNNFASGELIASIHAPGQYAVLPYTL